MRIPQTAVFLLSAIAVLCSQPAAAQGFKVYISVDIEGVAGLVDSSQMGPGSPEYALGRKLMTAEANAAVAAAFAAGATEVVVNDSHGSQINIQPDQLDRRALLITGQPKPFGMMQGIDGSYGAVIFIGYHAQASTADAVHAHTYTGQLKSVKLNGREVGEYGLNGSLAAHFGVPVVFLSGDSAVCKQAQAFFPGIQTVSVKEGIGIVAARSIHPEIACEKISAGVKAALARRAEIRPVQLLKPVTIEIELASPGQADLAMFVPEMKRLSGRTVSYTAPDMVVAYRISRLVARLAQ